MRFRTVTRRNGLTRDRPGSDGSDPPPRPHPATFRRRLLDDGIIRNAGLSEVSVADIEAARQVFPVTTVQNRYNLVDRESEDVLNYCHANNIGFIPWFPLAASELTQPGGRVDRIAKAHGATAGQVALAWLLQHSPVILPIPGTHRVAMTMGEAICRRVVP